MVCLSFGSIISKFTLSHILLPFYQFVFLHMPIISFPADCLHLVDVFCFNGTILQICHCCYAMSATNISG